MGKVILMNQYRDVRPGPNMVGVKTRKPKLIKQRKKRPTTKEKRMAQFLMDRFSSLKSGAPKQDRYVLGSDILEGYKDTHMFLGDKFDFGTVLEIFRRQLRRHGYELFWDIVGMERGRFNTNSWFKFQLGGEKPLWEIISQKKFKEIWGEKYPLTSQC